MASGGWHMAVQDEDARNGLAALLQAAGIDHQLMDQLSIEGADPVVPSRYRLGTASALVLGAQALGIVQIWRQRTGQTQRVQVNLRRAAYPGLCTFQHLQQNGHAVHSRWDLGAINFFPTRDDRRFYLFYSPVYQNHSLRLLAFLDATTQAESLARQVAQWNGQDLEDALAHEGLIGCVVRSREEWLAHPQGRWLASCGPVEIQRTDHDAPPRAWSSATRRPLDGVRIVDMSHVLAGPLVSRLLAEQGAEVLHVSAPHQPDGLLVDLDTGLGKRRAFIDLDRPGDIQLLRQLVRGADVFVTSWRPGALERRGLTARTLFDWSPGLIHVALSCYGDEGPWATRGGYEPVAQAATGYAMGEGTACRPLLACTGTLNDYLAAYLATTGVIGALLRQRAEGGSYRVRTSLAQSSMWVQSLGRLPSASWPGGPTGAKHLPELPESDFMYTETVFGQLRHPRPLVHFESTPPYWALAPQPPGASLPIWTS